MHRFRCVCPSAFVGLHKVFFCCFEGYKLDWSQAPEQQVAAMFAGESAAGPTAIVTAGADGAAASSGDGPLFPLPPRAGGNL